MARGVPNRSYRGVIDSLVKVWRIKRVEDGDAFIRQGEAHAFRLPSDPLRVTIWNLCKGVGGVLFEHDYRVLCYRSDILLAQEALLSAHGAKTFAHRGFEFLHAASYLRADSLRDGVMTLSRAPSLNPPVRIICKYPEPFLNTPKVSLVTFYELEGSDKPLMVVNMHATLMRGRAGAVAEIQHLIKALPSHEGPLLFAGDFNTFTKGYLESVSKCLLDIGLEYVPMVDDPRPKRAALDQVFVRGLRTVEAVVDTTIKNSDHFPLRCKFELTGTS